MPHLRGFDALVQELLQGEDVVGEGLAGGALGGALGGAAGLQGAARLQGALVGGPGGGLLGGAAAAAGPDLLVQTQAELTAALAVWPAHTAVQHP